MGTAFSNTASVDQLESALLGYQMVNFFPFNKPEAILFAKVKKGITDEVVLPLLKRLKPYTSYNPYLLTHALDKEVLTDSHTTCYCLHNLTYVVNHNENTNQVRIKINFPLLPVILKEYLYTKLSNRSEKVNIATYTAVRGYMLEAHLFKWDRNNIDVTILLNDNPLLTVLNFPQVNQVNEVLDDITKNILYQLRSDHPIIDGIEFITNELGDYWLVFIQVSVSPYSNHDPNLETLLSQKEGSKHYKELAGDDAPPTMFEYYENLTSKMDAFDKSRILYIYISTTTFYNNDTNVFKPMSRHSQQKCVVGLLSNESDFLKSCSMLYI